jgi:hypothetical protein
LSNEGVIAELIIEGNGKNSNVFIKAREDMMIEVKVVSRKCGIENFLNRKNECITCFSTFSSKVPIIFTFYVKMATKSIIMNTPLACSWCMSGCYLIAGSASVKRTIPFEMERIAALEALILLFSIVTTIHSTVRVVRLVRWSRNGNRGDHNLNLLWFFDLLSKVRLSNSLDMTFNFVSNQHVPFVDFVGFLQQHNSLFT